MKRCARCQVDKPIEAFVPGKRWSDGLFPYCRECKRLSDRESHARHRSDRNAAMRAHYKRNPEPYKERAMATYRVDPENWKAQVTVWRSANMDKVRLYRQAYVDTHREAVRENWRRRHARLLAATTAKLTIAAIQAKVAYWGDRCWMCGGEYEAIDHVKPLAKGGAHMLANLRPICRACNTRKRDRWPLMAAGRKES